MPRYARDTEVSVAQSRAEIERIVTRYGATQFYSGWTDKLSVIGFTASDRQVRFHLPLPSKEDEKYQITPSRGFKRSPGSVLAAWEQDCMQRWRALALVIKAKLAGQTCRLRRVAS